MLKKQDCLKSRKRVFIYLLFVWTFSSHSIFYSFWVVIIAGKGLQILTFLGKMPLSSDGSLACHTYCDTGHPFNIVISEES